MHLYHARTPLSTRRPTVLNSNNTNERDVSLMMVGHSRYTNVVQKSTLALPGKYLYIMAVPEIITYKNYLT